MKELDLMRLGRHVAQHEDAALVANDAAMNDATGAAAGARSESTRRYLAEYAARAASDGGGQPADEPPTRHERGELRHGGSPGPAPRARRSPGSGVGAAPLGSLASGSLTLWSRALSLVAWRRLGLAALVVASLWVARAALFTPEPLSFAIGPAGKSGLLHAWESAPADASLPIRFSDGTAVELSPGARARVVAVSERGAQIVLESGRAHFDVVPATAPAASESPWRVSLGPFSVEVKGTRFDVEWDPRTDAFALDLYEGSVRVSGCHEGHAHTLVAGQGVRASCSQERWTLVPASARSASGSGTPASETAPTAAAATTAAAEAPAATEVPAATEAPAATGPARTGDAPDRAGEEGSAPSKMADLGDSPREGRAADATDPPDTRGTARHRSDVRPAPERGSTRARARPSRADSRPISAQPAPSWQSLALRGHYTAAYERALDAGFESECERVGASDLVLLGDTARLGGDAARARSAYLAARRRFDGSPAAARAAYGLGRLAVKSDPRDASEWFECSLREAPRGPLAPAAHDWLFELADETATPARRRAAARRYLDQHPDGAHAGDARRILEANAR